MSKLHLNSIQAKVALQVRRDIAASCREEAQAMAESQLAQQQRLQHSSRLAKARGQIIHHEKRIFQSAESIQERQPITLKGKIIHHGPYPLISDDDKPTQAIRNQAPKAEVETMKQFKDRCLKQMRHQNEAKKRYEQALELQLQQQLQQSADPEHYFNDLMNLDQEKDRMLRIKNHQGIEDELIVSETVQEAFEEIFTVGTKTETRKKTPVPCWTLPPHELTPLPSPAKDMVPLAKPEVKVKAPCWTIPVEQPPRAVTISRVNPIKASPRNQLPQTRSSSSISPSPHVDLKEEEVYRDMRSASSDPPSQLLPELEVHLSPTSPSHGSEVIICLAALTLI